MANKSLGTLTLDLVAKVGGFEAGLGKAEREAKKRAQAIEKAFDGTFAVIGAGIASMAAAGTAALAIVNQQAEAIANYQDLAEKIGDTASAIASMQEAATVSGVALDTVSAASIRLTASLSKTDDETKLVGQAIQAIGLNFEEFKNQSPVEQIEAVANAMGDFADGSEKTAVAVALFGKAGAELIPFLNDLSDGSERQIRLTEEQIAAADEYTKAQARLRAEFSLFTQQQASELIPVLSELQSIFAELAQDETTVSVITESLRGTVGAAITVFQTLSVVAANVGFVLTSVGREIGAIAAQIAALAQGDLAGFRVISDAVKEDAARARSELDKFEARIMSIGKRTQSEGLNVSGIVDQYLPTAPRINTSGIAASSGGSSAAPKISEFQKYIDSLNKQIAGVKELTNAEKALEEIQSGRLGKVTDMQRVQAVTLAAQIDAAKLDAEAWSFVQKSIEDAAEASQNLLLESQKAAEAYRDLIDPAREVAREMQRIQELVDSGALTPDEGFEAQILKLKDSYKELGKDLDDFAKNAAENIQEALGDSLVDILDGNFKDIGSSFGKMIKNMLAEAAAANIARALFGDSVKGGSGSGGAGNFLSLLGGLFGLSGALASGGPTSAGGTYLVGEEGPELFTSNSNGYVMNAQQTAALSSTGSANGMGGITYAPVIQIDSRTDRAQIMQEIDRANKVASAELVDRLQRAGRI